METDEVKVPAGRAGRMPLTRPGARG